MVHNLAEFPAAVACAYASYRISGWFSAVLVQRGAPCCGASFYFSIQEYYVHDSVDGSRRRAPASRIASLQDCRTSGSHQCHCRSPRTEIGRAHVCTPVTNAHLVCRLLLENTK